MNTIVGDFNINPLEPGNVSALTFDLLLYLLW